jgi:hypothetical protein
MAETNSDTNILVQKNAHVYKKMHKIYLQQKKKTRTPTITLGLKIANLAKKMSGTAVDLCNSTRSLTNRIV